MSGSLFRVLAQRQCSSTSSSVVALAKHSQKNSKCGRLALKQRSSTSSSVVKSCQASTSPNALVKWLAQNRCPSTSSLTSTACPSFTGGSSSSVATAQFNDNRLPFLHEAGPVALFLANALNHFCTSGCSADVCMA
eukprot:1139091-Pelagomonas_calceolata.AAC.5